MGVIICDDWQSGGREGEHETQARRGKCQVRQSAHDLRRSFGERWASRLMPQVLKELMRHESIETTLNFYVGTQRADHGPGHLGAIRKSGRLVTLLVTVPRDGQQKPDNSRGN